MTRQNHLRLAGSAIAAALVLGTTPAFAQDAEAPGAPPITIVIPQPSAAPEPVPAAAAQIEAPVVTSAQDDLRAAPPSPQAAAERSVQRNRTAVAPRAVTAATVAPIAAAGLTASQSVVDAAPAAVLPAAVEAAPMAAPVATSDMGDEALFGAGLLAALGLGGLALAFTRRRRAKRSDVDRARAPVLVTPPAATIAPTPAPIVHRAPVPQWTSPAAFALPAAVPQDMQARRALIERMVTAKPDAANPFKSRKARTRRARLILAERIANPRPVLEDRVVARPAVTVAANPQREFEQA